LIIENFFVFRIYLITYSSTVIFLTKYAYNAVVTPLPFTNREEAGKLLGNRLSAYKKAEDTLILALVRGGIVVGAALSKALELPMFPYIVRKLGHPQHREFAVGAIAEGGATFLDDQAMQMHSVDWDELEEVIEEEQIELERRKETYMVKARPDLKDKTVILTDDGAATGSTLFVAIDDIKEAGATKIIVALPVCPANTANKIKEKADESEILETPDDFYAVGQFYKEFSEVGDEEVIKMLRSGDS